MDRLQKDELQALIEESGAPCVSLYLPTHRAGAETQQDPIRFKNLLKQAEERLVKSGLRRAEAEAILAPAKLLLKDRGFWQHQSDGLAVFASAGTFRSYRLPREFSELAVVTDRFHIKPLLTLFSGDGRFYVLALSQKQVRLLRGSRFSIDEVNLESLPKSLADALGFEERQKQLQFHIAARGAAIFHGHGGGGVDEAVHKKDLLRYFKQVDKGLQDLVCQEQVPLVLAGVDYLLPIYREANSCAELVKEGVVGNPDGLSAAELHRKAWAVVEAYFARAQAKAAQQYRELLGTGLVSGDLRTVVPAAHHGRVDSLFVAVGVQRWGRFTADASEVMVHEEREAGDQDLLDLAAVQTLVHAGEVYAVSADKLPETKSGSPVAAVFRY